MSLFIIISFSTLYYLTTSFLNVYVISFAMLLSLYNIKCVSFVSLFIVTYIKLNIVLVISSLKGSNLIIKFIAIKAYSSFSVLSN